MTVTLGFHGAAGTVTGSKYRIVTDTAQLLVDCGLFQGYKQLRTRNWSPLPFDPSDIDAVLLTHAHIDHSGYIPRLVRNGFRGQVYCTSGTLDLCRIMLPDSGHLHEREAEYLNRHKLSRHDPALPLYTQEDALASLKHFRPVGFGETLTPASGVAVQFRRAGHILGAASLEVAAEGRRIVFSGDLGRPGSPTMLNPETIRSADYLVVESTYGDRTHPEDDPEEALADIINRTYARGGTVLVPAFAVGRSQTLLYYIHRLKTERRIADLPVYLDSPMAIDATEIFARHPQDHKLTAAECKLAFHDVTYVHEGEDSRALDKDPGPKIIISASGMATGGRILHHLKHYVTDSRNTVLFSGFQAGGTRGAAMTRGARSIKIHGAFHEVRAEVSNLHMLSAHADADEIMDWLGHIETPPRMTFITHGEAEAADTLRFRIQNELGWDCQVPEHNSEHELS